MIKSFALAKELKIWHLQTPNYIKGEKEEEK
jgi:hypothetical protein